MKSSLTPIGCQWHVYSRRCGAVLPQPPAWPTVILVSELDSEPPPSARPTQLSQHKPCQRKSATGTRRQSHTSPLRSTTTQIGNGSTKSQKTSHATEECVTRDPSPGTRWCRWHRLLSKCPTLRAGREQHRHRPSASQHGPRCAAEPAPRFLGLKAPTYLAVPQA